MKELEPVPQPISCRPGPDRCMSLQLAEQGERSRGVKVG